MYQQKLCMLITIMITCGEPVESIAMSSRISKFGLFIFKILQFVRKYTNFVSFCKGFL